MYKMVFRVILLYTITLFYIVAQARDLNETNYTHISFDTNPNTTFPPLHLTSHYAFLRGNPKWPKKSLTYAYDWSVRDAAKNSMDLAFKEWEAHTDFKFTKLGYRQFKKANIRVAFESGDHGDGFPFGGAHMAHSFPPPDGRLHFDNNQNWRWPGKRKGYDFQTVALHEIGHTLGLDHSRNSNAVMYQTIYPDETKKLHQDDVAGIAALYSRRR